MMIGSGVPFGTPNLSFSRKFTYLTAVENNSLFTILFYNAISIKQIICASCHVKLFF